MRFSRRQFVKGGVSAFTVGFAAVETTPTHTNGYTRALSGVSLGGYGSSCPLFGLGRRATPDFTRELGALYSGHGGPLGQAGGSALDALASLPQHGLDDIANNRHWPN